MSDRYDSYDAARERDLEDEAAAAEQSAEDNEREAAFLDEDEHDPLVDLYPDLGGT